MKEVDSIINHLPTWKKQELMYKIPSKVVLNKLKQLKKIDVKEVLFEFDYFTNKLKLNYYDCLELLTLEIEKGF